MSATASRPSADSAILRARHSEDVVVGDEIVRHRLATRAIHWTVAFFFFVALFSGLPIWTPVFGWMAHFFGGLNVCRWLHPWAGILFFASAAVMFVHWLGDMRLEPSDREWLRPRKIAAYMKHQDDGTEGGKYNGGQKLFFFAAGLGALGLLLSGVVMWFPLEFPRILRELAILIHDVTFIFFVVAIVFHIYLGTAAEPGTFHSMIRGTVSKPWARLHHPRWYREVLGGKTRRP
jgi:formate dehydrogenase subunit gamma